MEQKPVAEVHKTYVQKDEFTLQAIFYPPYNVGNGDKLFTEDQLKAEREKAIMQVREIVYKTVSENCSTCLRLIDELLSTDESKE
jgi:hypothetical protein